MPHLYSSWNSYRKRETRRLELLLSAKDLTKCLPSDCPEIEERLEELAKKTGRTKTFYAREAILEYLEDLEGLYLAEKRYEDILKGRATTIPLEDVMKRYGLEA